MCPSVYNANYRFILKKKHFIQKTSLKRACIIYSLCIIYMTLNNNLLFISKKKISLFHTNIFENNTTDNKHVLKYIKYKKNIGLETYKSSINPDLSVIVYFLFRTVTETK